MSGFKRAMVTISEEEYRKLHNADIEKRFKISKPVKEVDHQGQILVLEKNLSDMLNRQNDYEKLVAALGNEISNFEIEAERAILEEKIANFREMTEHLDDLWENSNRIETIVLNFQEQNIRDGLQRDKFMEQVAYQVESIVTDLACQQEKKSEIAIGWLKDCGELAEFISIQYDHNRFFPGELNKIHQLLHQVAANLSMGMPEAALGGAQQVKLRLSELHLQLEQKTLEWQTICQITFQAANDLYDLMKNNSNCPALDMQGRELPIPLQLNFWSNNQYNDLVLRLKNTILCVKSNLATVSSQDLEFILKETLPVYRREFDNIIYQARLAAINSQLRINIADIALEALTTQGFVENEYGYVSDDRRGTYFLRVKNIEGSEVTIWVNPVDNQQNRSDLVVQSSDVDQKSEHELIGRSNEIIQTLLKHELRVTHVESLPVQVLMQTPDGYQAPSQTRQPDRSYKRSRPNSYAGNAAVLKKPEEEWINLPGNTRNPQIQRR